MFGRVRRAASSATERESASTPPGTLVWVVGDVHGCADLLDVLLYGVVEDIDLTRATVTHLVFLGDYVDRGPDSRAVLDRLIALQDAKQIELHFLRGNHEDRMEAFLERSDLGAGWCDFGGRETLGSFGVHPPEASDSPEAWETASRALASAMMERHRRFLRRLGSSVTIGDYFFAHAGAEPGVALEKQDPQQLMWIRRRFLEHPEPFEKMIVHGHTPTPHVYVDHRRIGIDTGAYATGVLTALRLMGRERRLLQTERRGASITLASSSLHARD